MRNEASFLIPHSLTPNTNTNTNTIMRPVNHNTSLIILISLLFVFLLPIIASTIFYHHGHQWVKKTTNKGKWILPTLSFQELSITPSKTDKKWMLMLFNPKRCDAFCNTQIKSMQQITKAIGEDQYRISVSILTNHLPQKPLPVDFFILHHHQFNHQLISGQIYIVDPLGNIILSYKKNTPPSNILKDLKKLVRNSKAG